MPPNSVSDCDPRADFFRLFQQYWKDGTGRARIALQGDGRWTVQTFIAAATRAGHPIKDRDTIGAWLKGEQVPKQSRFLSIEAAFFPAGSPHQAERAALRAAWKRASGAPAPSPTPPARDDTALAPQWRMHDQSKTEGLATVILHQPDPLDAPGAYELNATVRLDVFATDDGLDIGVKQAVLVVELQHYNVAQGSAYGERASQPGVTMAADGTRFTATNNTFMLSGDLLNGKSPASIESRNTGEGCVTLSLRTLQKRGFQVLRMQGDTPVAATEEQDAVANLLLGKDRRDSLGRVILAEDSMTRLPDDPADP